MIKCISYWSLEHGLDNTHPIDDALAEAKAAGFDGLELAIAPAGNGILTTGSSQADCEDIRRRIDDSGLVVETLACGISWGANPVSDDPAVRDESVKLHDAALQRAAWLGCKAMLMVPGVVTSPIAPDERVRYDHALDRCRENTRRLAETAERVGVDLCLENVWNGLFYSPVEFASFVDDVGSGRVGVYLDVGNLLGYQQYPPHWIELLGKRIKRVHFKDYSEEFGWEGRYAFSKLGEGDVPWPETVDALQKIGYEKTVVAEMLPWSEGLLEHTSQAMDRILGRG